jgi:hypothetical protein
LELVSLPPELPVLYVKDAFNPWYVVVVPQKIRRYLNPNSRFTLEVESPDAVREAHEEFARGEDARITYLGALSEESDRAHFFLTDPAKNWWEVSAPPKPVACSS